MGETKLILIQNFSTSKNTKLYHRANISMSVPKLGGLKLLENKLSEAWKESIILSQLPPSPKSLLPLEINIMPRTVSHTFQWNIVTSSPTLQGPNSFHGEGDVNWKVGA